MHACTSASVTRWKPARTGRLDELARHFTAAGPEERDRAVLYALRAAEQATERLAYGEAADLLAGALAARERDEPVDEGERARLLHDLALARWRLGLVQESRDTFNLATEAARRAGAGGALRALRAGPFGQRLGAVRNR